MQELNRKAEDPALWDDPQQAQQLMRERQLLDEKIRRIRDFEQRLEENVELIEMAEAEGDEDIVAEAAEHIRQMRDELGKLEVESLLSGEADANNAYVEIHAGAGGTESQDWASMLMRMYVRWAEQHGYKVDVVEESRGEEAGIKSATLHIRGHNAYGWLKTESGVHRLVRISPFDASARRHTSFASVWVYPEIDDNIEVEIADSDVRIDTFRASGAGGQHVNTTDSAVRITHLPTGIVGTRQNERSQHQNRAQAWKMLRARLYEHELRKREEEAMKEQEAKTDIGWGHQIRSYVLQPYQLVKDLRTGVESTNPQAVLDGDLDQFIEAALAQRVHGGKEEGSSGGDEART